MKLLSTTLLGLILATVVNVSTVQAVDAIYFEGGGSTLRGNINGFTKDVVKIQQGANEREVPVNTIRTINWDNESRDLKKARTLEQQGNSTEALELYESAKGDLDSLNKNAQSDFNYLKARAEARAAMGDSSRIDAAIKALEDFKAANRNHFRYYELHKFLGNLYSAKGDTANATASFNEMKSAPFKDYQMSAQILAADALLKNGKLKEAEQEYQAVAQMQTETPQETARKNEARLGLAYCKTQQGSPADAVAIAESVIAETDSLETGVQARAFLRKGDALLALEKPQQAVIAYLAVDLLFPSEPELHAEALHQLSQLWGKIGKADRASDAQARLQSQYPGSPWAKAN